MSVNTCFRGKGVRKTGDIELSKSTSIASRSTQLVRKRIHVLDWGNFTILTRREKRHRKKRIYEAGGVKES